MPINFLASQPLPQKDYTDSRTTSTLTLTATQMQGQTPEPIPKLTVDCRFRFQGDSITLPAVDHASPALYHLPISGNKSGAGCGMWRPHRCPQISRAHTGE